MPSWLTWSRMSPGELLKANWVGRAEAKKPLAVNAQGLFSKGLLPLAHRQAQTVCVLVNGGQLNCEPSRYTI